jgi:adenine phosphoribosyltransferase
VINKVGGENITKGREYQVKTLINIDVVGGKVIIVDEHGDG